MSSFLSLSKIVKYLKVSIENFGKRKSWEWVNNFDQLDFLIPSCYKTNNKTKNQKIFKSLQTKPKRCKTFLEKDWRKALWISLWKNCGKIVDKLVEKPVENLWKNRGGGESQVRKKRANLRIPPIPSKKNLTRN